jgi:8-amino-7-oxononanoate synthase
MRWSVSPSEGSQVSARRPRQALDFTSSLYLGLLHPSRALPAWSRLTMGVPAVLREAPESRAVATSLAGLAGCAHGILAPSTLHLFLDLFASWISPGTTIYMDAGVYPIARWGVECAAARGVPVREFAHHDPPALRRLLMRDDSAHGRPLVVVDGFCPPCGRAAPLPGYLEAARRFGGRLIVDDTQAFGVFGRRSTLAASWGCGGGGSLAWHGIGGSDVIVIASLAKGFGVPVAFLGGSAATVHRFDDRSATRVHCSPPSVVVTMAAARALAVNRRCGDAIRAHLAGLVRHFRHRLAEIGWPAAGDLFPVQMLVSVPSVDLVRLHTQLERAGISALLLRGHDSGAPRLAWVITARHHRVDLDRAADALERSALADPVTIKGDVL